MSKIVERRPQSLPPEPLPNAISFDLGGSRASHEDVYNQLGAYLKSFGDFHIKSLQFVALSFRWVVLLDSKTARDRIAGGRVNINGRTVLLRRYDDVMLLEYKKYLRGNGLVDMFKQT